MTSKLELWPERRNSSGNNHKSIKRFYSTIFILSHNQITVVKPVKGFLLGRHWSQSELDQDFFGVGKVSKTDSLVSVWIRDLIYLDRAGVDLNYDNLLGLLSTNSVWSKDSRIRMFFPLHLCKSHQVWIWMLTGWTADTPARLHQMLTACYVYDRGYVIKYPARLRNFLRDIGNVLK